jgi:lipopolysaccharide/colanic/teichoic acid biosynthesis glycosyltransferase/glycosyltransferase involved in cell wall biosynthesis
MLDKKRHDESKPIVAHIATVPLSFKYLLLNQLKELVAGGYQVVAISSPGPEVALVKGENIPHFAVTITRRITPLKDMVSLWQLFRLLRRNNFHIVHTHNPKPGFLGQVAARLAGTPVVVNTIHGFYFTNHTHPMLRWMFILMEKVAASCSDVIWSQNEEDIETAVRERICPANKIRYLGNGIDLNRFDRTRISGHTIRQKKAALHILTKSPVVGFVGRLVTEKGVHELMQAALLVRQALPDVRFLIVGATDSEKRDAITPQIVYQYDLEINCIFTGQRDDMPELYALMDVFVLPSHREGLPRAPMEASAMQVPCVVTDVRGCREVVFHERNGLVVPLQDVDALGQAIIRLLQDKKLAQQLGKNGRQIAEEQFDEQEVFTKIKAEYVRLLRQKGLPLPQPSWTETSPLASMNTLNSNLPKRLFDLFASALMLLMFSPLLILLTLLIRFSLGSPVFFRQQRPGLNGRSFTLIKFRTMTDKRDAAGNLLPDGQRLTKFGRFLRAASLDELPELWNVLQGEMSLVGPRPLLMHYLPLYTPEQMRRHAVRPGITGWAQVNGRNALTWEEKFALDLWYVDNHTLWLDLKILCLTLFQIVKRDGINQPGQATMKPFEGSS